MTQASIGVWAALSAPLTKDEVSWRIDGKPTEKNGKFAARVVAYCDVPAVVRRLNAACAGDWSFRASDPFTAADGDGVAGTAIKGTLEIDNVARSDYGIGPDAKQALTDAFKRTARLFGIALELWDMDPIWTDVSDGSKYAKITGDPWRRYEQQRSGGGRQEGRASNDAGQSAQSGTHTTTAATAQPTASSADQFVMQFGRSKGKKLGELSTETLQGIAEWITEHSLTKKHADVMEAIGIVLGVREDQGQAA